MFSCILLGHRIYLLPGIMLRSDLNWGLGQQGVVGAALRRVRHSLRGRKILEGFKAEVAVSFHSKQAIFLVVEAQNDLPVQYHFIWVRPDFSIPSVSISKFQGPFLPDRHPNFHVGNLARVNPAAEIQQLSIVPGCQRQGLSWNISSFQKSPELIINTPELLVFLCQSPGAPSPAVTAKHEVLGTTAHGCGWRCLTVTSLPRPLSAEPCTAWDPRALLNRPPNPICTGLPAGTSPTASAVSVWIQARDRHHTAISTGSLVSGVMKL